MENQKDFLKDKKLLVPLIESGYDNLNEEREWRLDDRRKKRITAQLRQHCLCFIPLKQLPRFTLVKVMLLLALFVFFILVVLHYDYGIIPYKSIFMAPLLFIHGVLLIFLISSIPYRTFSLICNPSQNNWQSLSRMGFSFFLVVLLNLFISPFLIFSEILFILKVCNIISRWSSVLGAIFGLEAGAVAVFPVVGCAIMRIPATSKTTKIALIYFSLHLSTVAILLMIFTFYISSQLEQENSTYLSVFTPVFIAGALHFVFSGILASQSYFSGQIFGLGKLKPTARYFYSFFSLLSNLITLSFILLVIYLDTQILNLTIVFLPIGILLTFLLSWITIEGIIQHKKDSMKKVESYSFHLEQKRSLLEDLSTLINNKEFSDVTFIIGGQQCYAHRAILSCRSSYFKKLFYGPFKHQSEVNVPDVNFNTFKSMLTFLYTGKTLVTMDILFDLMLLADQYEVLTLLSICEDYFIKKINNENVVDMLLAADTCMGAIRLKKTAIQYLIYKMKIGELSITHKRFQTLPKLVFAEIAEAVLKKKVNFSEQISEEQV